MSTLIVLVGPTGVGKTAVSIQIAQHLNSPIMNVDSRQLYREIPIGTAAPTAIELRMVRHYFVGAQTITDYYSAAQFETEALRVAQTYFENGGKMLLASGGSMLYIDALCKGIDDIPTIRPEVRQEMMQLLESEGLEKMCELLHEWDPEHWAVVDRNNPRRVIHALEICKQTGRTYTSFRSNTIKERPFNIIKIGLNRDRDTLYQRINQRVLQMIDDGMIEEAQRVYPKRMLNSLNTVGYKELFEYLDGLTTLDEAIFKIQSSTRRYARKQLTWYKRDAEMTWFSPDNIEEILNYLSTISL